MIIVENQVVFDDVNALLPEAQSRFDSLSKVFSQDEIRSLTENLVKSEPLVAIALGSINENIQLNEFIVKHVSAKGEVTKTQDRKTRERKAFQTTGLSKSARRQIARKAAKTKKANPSEKVRTVKKRKKAMDKRKRLGLD
jgi:hypothetical protein